MVRVRVRVRHSFTEVKVRVRVRVRHSKLMAKHSRAGLVNKRKSRKRVTSAPSLANGCCRHLVVIGVW